MPSIVAGKGAGFNGRILGLHLENAILQLVMAIESFILEGMIQRSN